jgi:ribonuclease-3
MQANARLQLLHALCDRLGYSFKRSELLIQAITHRSHSASHNERLEFLGDAVLNCIIADMLYKHFQDLPEGQLSRIRANFVNQHALAELALKLQLNGVIRLGEGEIKSGGHNRPSILADALEAIIGAIFLDSDFARAEEIVAVLYQPLMHTIDVHEQRKDPKTLLQEFLQSRKLVPPEYVVINTTGQAHQQKFQVECIVPKFGLRTVGEGTSRRNAEQEAAKRAYENLSTSQLNE